MAINNNCSSKQTFCETSGQTISDYSDLKFDYSTPINDNAIILDDMWNDIVEEIIKIYNYGNKGTRNPVKPMTLETPNELGLTLSGTNEWRDNTPKYSTSDYSSKLKFVGDFIPLIDYNNILSTISQTPLNSLNSYIEKEKFLQIKDNINNLQFFNNRCNDCNVACNATCEAQSECYCDCDCYTECYCQCDHCDCYSSCACQDSGTGGCGCTVCLDL